MYSVTFRCGWRSQVTLSVCVCVCVSVTSWNWFDELLCLLARVVFTDSFLLQCELPNVWTHQTCSSFTHFFKHGTRLTSCQSFFVGVFVFLLCLLAFFFIFETFLTVQFSLCRAGGHTYIYITSQQFALIITPGWCLKWRHTVLHILICTLTEVLYWSTNPKCLYFVLVLLHDFHWIEAATCLCLPLLVLSGTFSVTKICFCTAEFFLFSKWGACALKQSSRQADGRTDEDSTTEFGRRQLQTRSVWMKIHLSVAEPQLLWGERKLLSLFPETEWGEKVSQFVCVVCVWVWRTLSVNELWMYTSIT